MEEIKRKLVESGVIGRVVDDLNPRMGVILEYGDKRINIGDTVRRADLQRKPTYLEHYGDDPDLHKENFKNDAVILVMTDPNAPGGEYLRWLICYFIVSERKEEFFWEEFCNYRPPRRGAHEIVLTIFKIEEAEPIIDLHMPKRYRPIILPNTRKNFSTRAFAAANAFEPPLCVSFFNVRDEKEDDKRKVNQSRAAVIGPTNSGKRIQNEKLIN